MITSVATVDYYYPREFVAPVSSSSQPFALPRYRIPPNANVGTAEYAGFDVHFSKLNALTINEALWPDGAEPPTLHAVAWAQLVLQQLELDDVLPTRVVASVEGGIGICFVDGNKYADIECLNSGAILGVISNKTDRPCVWEVEQGARDVARASQRIREFIFASKAPTHVAKWAWYR